MRGLDTAAPDAADQVSVLSSCRQVSHPNSDLKSNCACKTGGGSTQPSQTLQITSLDGLGPVNVASDTAISPVFTLWLTLMLMFIGEPLFILCSRMVVALSNADTPGMVQALWHSSCWCP